MRAQPPAEFYANPRTADRLGSWCKTCERARGRGRREETRAYRRTSGYSAAKAKYRSSEKAKETERAYVEKVKVTSPERLRARWTLGGKKRTGAVVAPDACEACERPGPVQAHHHDYAKPLDVVWLCVACHADEHARDDG